jgi:hypothetical protein
MNQFVNAIQEQESRTANGMKARKTTSNALVDLFYAIGASRGKNIIPAFTAAYVQDRDLALRIALWCRDIRMGSGEREVFKQILNYLEVNSPEDCKRLLQKLPELGRWDDGLCLKTKEMKSFYFSMLGDAIRNGQNAKTMLTSLDNLSEEECADILSRL